MGNALKRIATSASSDGEKRKEKKSPCVSLASPWWVVTDRCGRTWRSTKVRPRSLPSVLASCRGRSLVDSGRLHLRRVFAVPRICVRIQWLSDSWVFARICARNRERQMWEEPSAENPRCPLISFTFISRGASCRQAFITGRDFTRETSRLGRCQSLVYRWYSLLIKSK